MAKTLHLKDVIHLIGLPGSGKTTLLTCLAIYLARKKIKILMLFPKIETALNYLNHLKYYQVVVKKMAASFDVVIVDEVDNAQQTLDDISLSEITLSGFKETDAPLFFVSPHDLVFDKLDQ